MQSSVSRLFVMWHWRHVLLVTGVHRTKVVVVSVLLPQSLASKGGFNAKLLAVATFPSMGCFQRQGGRHRMGLVGPGRRISLRDDLKAIGEFINKWGNWIRFHNGFGPPSSFSTISGIYGKDTRIVNELLSFSWWAGVERERGGGAIGYFSTKFAPQRQTFKINVG